jgi:hypothetical protein
VGAFGDLVQDILMAGCTYLRIEIIVRVLVDARRIGMALPVVSAAVALLAGELPVHRHVIAFHVD